MNCAVSFQSNVNEAEIYKQALWQFPIVPIRLKSQGHHIGLDFLVKHQWKREKTMAGSWQEKRSSDVIMSLRI